MGHSSTGITPDGGFMFNIKFDHQSVIGHVRDINEDTYTVMHGNETSGSLAVVCDGMGGVVGGEIASRIVCETFYDFPVYGDGIKPFNAGSNRKRLERLIRVANDKIRTFVRHHPRYKGMGTTVSALLFLEDKIVVAHVGDSRIYRLRDGQLTRLTKDQTLLDHLMQTGKISPDDAHGHPSGHILMQAVGASTHLRHIQSQVDDLSGGDIFLICSDGLSDLVQDDEIQETLLTRSLEQVCGDLVRLALRRGGNDNVTIIAAEVTEAAMHRQAA
jgi:PPM family protein phosphatase